MTLAARYLSLLAAALVLTACGTPPQAPDTVRMAVQEGGTAITGSYRSAGFSQTQVRQMVGRICTSAGTAGFNQTVTGDLVTFSAACAAPTRYTSGATALFEAQDDGTVDYRIDYKLNGQPFDTGGNFAV